MSFYLFYVWTARREGNKYLPYQGQGQMIQFTPWGLMYCFTVLPCHVFFTFPSRLVPWQFWNKIQNLYYVNFLELHIFPKAIYYPTLNAILNKLPSLSLHKVEWQPLVLKPWKEETLLFGDAHMMMTCRRWTLLLENFHPRSFHKSFWDIALNSLWLYV
jgi:hypothetical protein